jgi:aldose 1-epimerase
MKLVHLLTLFFLSGAVLISAQTTKPAKPTMTKELFGKSRDGQPIDLYTLANANGMKAKITTYGGILTSVEVPDRNGKIDDVVLGFNDLEEYLKGHPSFGTLPGRYANRIGKARFTLNGKEYKLAANNGENTLHGGRKGFDKYVWSGKESPAKDGVAVELTHLSPDGDEGFPGAVTVKVVYTLTNKNELRLDYSAVSDQDTVVNLTNHSYFNLAGAGNGDILNQEIMINADRFTPVDAGLIPTGEMKNVKGTALDFTKPVKIGARIDADEEQIKLGKGYDHNLIVNGKPGSLRLAARASDSASGRILEVWTTEPGVQFYTANNLDGSRTGKGGKVYVRRGGFCLETQHFPDSPNKANFPTTTLKKGEKFQSTTVFKFMTAK